VALRGHAQVIKHLTLPRPVNANRAEIIAQAETFACLVSLEFVGVLGKRTPPPTAAPERPPKRGFSSMHAGPRDQPLVCSPDRRKTVAHVDTDEQANALFEMKQQVAGCGWGSPPPARGYGGARVRG
jgi:hypothetical protein